MPTEVTYAALLNPYYPAFIDDWRLVFPFHDHGWYVGAAADMLSGLLRVWLDDQLNCLSGRRKIINWIDSGKLTTTSTPWGTGLSVTFLLYPNGYVGFPE